MGGDGDGGGIGAGDTNPTPFHKTLPSLILGVK